MKIKEKFFILFFILLFFVLNIGAVFGIYHTWFYHPEIKDCSYETWTQYACHPDYYEKCWNEGIYDEGIYGWVSCFNWSLLIIIVDIGLFVTFLAFSIKEPDKH